MQTQTAILIGAAAATIGWLYTARRGRILARKQFTINILLNSSFNKDLRDAFKLLSPSIRARQPIAVSANDDSNIRDALRLVLNHYEFIGAGIRNGDVDERLILDSERGTVLTIFECSETHIESLRNTRRRRAIHEHLEWLYRRWEKKPPGKFCWCAEKIWGRPFPGCREKTREE